MNIETVTNTTELSDLYEQVMIDCGFNPADYSHLDYAETADAIRSKAPHQEELANLLEQMEARWYELDARWYELDA